MDNSTLKVALVACPAWESVAPHPALLALAPVIAATGSCCEVYDLNVDFWRSMVSARDLWCSENSVFWNDSEKLDALFADHIAIISAAAERIAGSGAAIILFTVNCGAFLFTLRFARILRRLTAAAFVIGGPDCFRGENYQKYVSSGLFSAVCTGEGELALPRLLHAFNQYGKTPSDLAGFTVIDSDGAVSDNGDPERPARLDKLPLIDLLGFDLSNYQLSNRLHLHLSRGCINRCSFCSESPNYGKFRSRSAGRVIEQLEKVLPELAKSGQIPHINFNDSLINGNIRVLDEVCEQILARGLNFRWGGMAYVRPEMTYDFLAKMHRAGCVEITWGVESGSNKILKLMRKRFNVALLDRVVNDCAAIGIEIYGNLIIGFPGETPREFAETLFFLTKNGHKFVKIGLPLTSILNNTPLRDNLDEFGINEYKTTDWESVDGRNNIMVRALRLQLLERVLADKKFDQGNYKNLISGSDCDAWVAMELRESLTAYADVCCEYFSGRGDYFASLTEQVIDSGSVSTSSAVVAAIKNSVAAAAAFLVCVKRSTNSPLDKGLAPVILAAACELARQLETLLELLAPISKSAGLTGFYLAMAAACQTLIDGLAVIEPDSSALVVISAMGLLPYAAALIVETEGRIQLERLTAA